MTDIFDGMATALNDTFGAVVVHTPAGGVPREIMAVLRLDPVEMPDDDGRVILLLSPSLRVLRADANDIATGDTIASVSGAVYRVENRLPSVSPAADAFVTFEIEEKEV